MIFQCHLSTNREDSLLTAVSREYSLSYLIGHLATSLRFLNNVVQFSFL